MDGQKTLGGANPLTRQSEILLSAGLLGVLVVLLIPLPTFLLDMFLAGNLAITILLLLITISVTQPLEISVFPSLLLLMTLSRLSLNVATTRLILLDGNAGKIVSTFGGFVVGGNLVVGLVIFLILIVIQFIVITKGASRISEVAARFTLDALPGKQMAIDAEVNSGALNDEQARKRRKELAQETEFYGSMDGAGKFVRGDAIAGLIITGINLVGGVALGVSNGLTIWEAITRYSILTIGDGLISQIPALIIATSAGILVTKATSEISLGGEIGVQLLSNSRPLIIGAVILGAVALTPGLPKLPFAAIAAALVFAGRRIGNTKEETEQPEPEGEQTVSKQEQQFDDFLQSDRARIEVGVRLIPLVSANEQGLADRIAALRKELADKHGIWVPAVRIRDSLQLNPDEYRILINGREVARATMKPDHFMAINPTADTSSFGMGEETTDPAFGLKAIWIPEDMRARAELKGMTVVDHPTVMMTHLGEVLRRLAHELLGREDMQKLINKVKETSPSVVDELKPEIIRMGDVHQVLSLLLKEKIPLTNLTRILEAISHCAADGKSPADIAESVREYLGREIFARLRTDGGNVSVIVLDPRIEVQLRESTSDGRIVLPHTALQQLMSVLHDTVTHATQSGKEVALLTDKSLRRSIRQLLERSLPDLAVVTINEVPSDITIDISNVIKYESIFNKQDGAAAA
ncbi:MAG: FHIPEP family type III secretion protein [Planctomycetales bacterium]|nr:FHIPEP family type III secretion protein [Planctomycetales bacterium]